MKKLLINYEEDFVNLESAKLLKKLGYDFNNNFFWIKDKLEFHFKDTSTLTESEYLAPTLYSAIKWISNKLSIFIKIGICPEGYYFETFNSIDGQFLKIPGITETGGHLTPQAAMKEGISTVLNYIINKNNG